MGHFLSIEGGEGVGKSSFLKGLILYLEEQGQVVVATREPGGTPVAQAIRELFLHPPESDTLEPRTELFLMAAARAQHVSRVIKPALENGSWVLCDRFCDSTRVYQGKIGGMPSDILEFSIEAAIDGCVPELTFLLDCPIEVALKRLSERAGKETRFDQAVASFHERLREGFLELARSFPQRFALLDASKTQNEVLEQAQYELSKRFGV